MERRLRAAAAARRRARLRRGVNARLAVVAYVFRQLGPPLAAVALYAVAATLLVRWDMRRTGHVPGDFVATLYGLFTQLFFEVSADFPPSLLSRAIYFVTPLVGAVLVAEGLLKVGASLFDPETRTKVWGSIMSDQMRGHVVVVGLGHVGYRVVEELVRMGQELVCLDMGAKDSFVEQVRTMGIPVHVGDARRDELMAEAGVARAQAIVCATGDDLANLEIALDAKRMAPSIRVVMRMFDQRLAGKVGGALELDESFSTSALTAPIIAMQATQPGVCSAYRLDDVVRVTAEVTVGETHTAASVADVELSAICRIVSRRAKGAASFATVKASDMVRPGDVVVVDAAAVDLPGVRFKLGA